jgi:transcriptional regulator with XRE-family HTH domain
VRRTLLGLRLERARVDAGLTRDDAVDVLHLSTVGVLDDWESGKRTPAVAMLARIVDAYSATDAYALNGAAKSSDLLAELVELRARHRPRRRPPNGAAVATVALVLLSVGGIL